MPSYDVTSAWDAAAANLSDAIVQNNAAAVRTLYPAALSAYTDLSDAGLVTARALDDWNTLRTQALDLAPDAGSGVATTHIAPAAAKPSILTANGLTIGKITVPWAGVAAVVLFVVVAWYITHKRGR